MRTNKISKKILAPILCIMMVLTMTMTAFASDTSAHAVTITNEASGYVYTAYQIFSGVASDDDTTLSDIVWGSSIDTSKLDELYAALAEIETSSGQYGFAGCETAADVADVLDGLAYDAAVAQAFAEVVSDYLNGSGIDSEYVAEEGDVLAHYTISGLYAGYYLIMNTQVPTGTNSAYTRYILEIAKDMTVKPKSGTPTSDKEVVNADGESIDAADFSVGDEIGFILTADMPDNYGDYETYDLVFHDEVTGGLAVNTDSVVVTVKTGDVTTTVSGGFTIATPTSNPAVSDDCAIEVIIADANALTDSDGNPIEVTYESTITVTYTATLTEDAVIGGEGNSNTMHLEYSNNPNHSGSGNTSDTPDEKTVVYTFELDVNKIDSYNVPLTGAGFTLYKASDAAEVSENGWAEGTDYIIDDDGQYWKIVTVCEASDTVSSFTFKGLSTGDYLLSETEVPDGYNSLDDIAFSIVAEYDEDGVKSLSVVDADGNVMSSFTVSSASSGVISASVMNKAGSILPETGGTGTKMIYAAGGVVLIAAIAVLAVAFAKPKKKETN